MNWWFVSGIVLGAQSVTSGSSVTGFAITRDAAGNFLANVAADSWTLINKTGGVACGRKLRIKLYDVNALDTNDAQAKCLQRVEDKPYVVLDFGGYLGQATRA